MDWVCKKVYVQEKTNCVDTFVESTWTGLWKCNCLNSRSSSSSIKHIEKMNGGNCMWFCYSLHKTLVNVWQCCKWKFRASHNPKTKVYYSWRYDKHFENIWDCNHQILNYLWGRELLLLYKYNVKIRRQSDFEKNWNRVCVGRFFKCRHLETSLLQTFFVPNLP